MLRKDVLPTLAVADALATMLACGAGSGDTSSSVTGGDGKPVEAAAPEKTTAVAKVGQSITLSNELLGEKDVVELTVTHAHPPSHVRLGDPVPGSPPPLLRDSAIRHRTPAPAPLGARHHRAAVTHQGWLDPPRHRQPADGDGHATACPVPSLTPDLALTTTEPTEEPIP